MQFCAARRRSTAQQSYRSVELPESVIDILTGVRNYLQASAGCRTTVVGAAPGLHLALLQCEVAPTGQQKVLVCLFNPRSQGRLPAPPSVPAKAFLPDPESHRRPPVSAGQVRAAGVRV